MTDGHSPPMRGLFNSIGHPRGLTGRFVLHKMVKGHGPLLRWVLEIIDLKSVTRILDVGCGRGESLRMLGNMSSKFELTGLDISDTSVASAKRNCRNLISMDRCRIVQGEVDTLPFDDNQFNMVLAIETYFFWPDLGHGLDEIHRVLTPGGRFILVSEAYDHPAFKERNGLWEKRCDIRFLGPEEIEATMIGSGFDTEIMVDEERNWILAIGRV